MSKPVLVVTRRLTADVEARIEREYDVRRHAGGGAFTNDELLEAADGAVAILLTPANRLDRAFFTGLPGSVKVIATYSVGYDHVDLA